MPYPAYEGILFYFSITIGSPWRQEFRALDRAAPTGDLTDAGVWDDFAAKMVLTTDTGGTVATLTNDGSGNGSIRLGSTDLGPDAIVCELPSSFTVGLAPTTTYNRTSTKPFVRAVLTLTDPARPLEPYVFAAGKGVIVPTTL